MNYPRLILSIIATFIFVFAFEFAYHGVFLKKIYSQTAHLWRPEADMMAYMPFAIIFQLSFAAILAILYARNAKTYTLSEGLAFGCLLGLFAGIINASMYPYQPLPEILVAFWFLGNVLEITCAGAVAALVYKPKP